MMDNAVNIQKSDTKYWLVTYEWRRTRGEWRRENEAINVCPGVWWAKLEQRRRDGEAKERDEAAKYEARGENVPIIIYNYAKQEQRFLYATPISEEGYRATNA